MVPLGALVSQMYVRIALIGKRHQDLGSLVVGGGAAEIAAAPAAASTFQCQVRYGIWAGSTSTERSSAEGST